MELEAKDNGEDEVVPERHHAFGQKRTGREILPQVPQAQQQTACMIREKFIFCDVGNNAILQS